MWEVQLIESSEFSNPHFPHLIHPVLGQQLIIPSPVIYVMNTGIPYSIALRFIAKYYLQMLHLSQTRGKTLHPQKDYNSLYCDTCLGRVVWDPNHVTSKVCLNETCSILHYVCHLRLNFPLFRDSLSSIFKLATVRNADPWVPFWKDWIGNSEAGPSHLWWNSPAGDSKACWIL